MTKYEWSQLSPTDRFLALIKHDDGCWEWQGVKYTTGYGHLRIGGRRRVSAHRFSYEFFCEPIPKGMCVLHRCDNPGCVRPDHLFLGTKADNAFDMALKERAGRRRFKREEAYAVLWREASGEACANLAVEHGVTLQAIRALVQRRTWPLLSQSHD